MGVARARLRVGVGYNETANLTSSATGVFVLNRPPGLDAITAVNAGDQLDIRARRSLIFCCKLGNQATDIIGLLTTILMLGLTRLLRACGCAHTPDIDLRKVRTERFI